MHCVRIELVGALLPNCSVVDYRCVISIAPAIGWIIPIVRLFGDDKPWTHFVLFLFSDRSVSGIVT